MLAIITKMTLTQVSTWFANARRRLKKENKMQWSPRNRTDNDDDDKSTSDDDAETGNGKNDDVTAGNGTETRMAIGSKDSDDDVVVDNVGKIYTFMKIFIYHSWQIRCAGGAVVSALHCHIEVHSWVQSQARTNLDNNNNNNNNNKYICNALNSPKPQMRLTAHPAYSAAMNRSGLYLLGRR